jgi:hypothetical protein
LSAVITRGLSRSTRSDTFSTLALPSFPVRDIVSPTSRDNKVSRADFLRACGVALLGVSVGGHEQLMEGAARLVMEHGRAEGSFPLRYGADQFRGHVSTSFSVRSAGGRRERMVLSKIVERPLTKNVEQFSLIFHARPGASFSQGTYAFRHGVLGDFDWFIVPINSPNTQRAIYEACFSRHLGADEAGRTSGPAASLRRRT